MSNKNQVRLDWKDRVIAFRASGLSMNKWCDQQGVKVHQLHYWLKKYPEMTNPSKQEWVPVNLVNEPQPLNKSSSLKISIGKCTIELNPNFDSTLLIEVVKVLSEAC